MAREKYISKAILDWFVHSETSTVYADNWQRPYQIWEHAKQILESNKGKFHLIDAIGALKRSVDYRIKDLNEKYNLKSISPSLKKKGSIERLSEFSIIKPLMLSKLLDIRNQVEHQDADPPDHSRCDELLEFVWYFLKSTDHMAHYVPTSLLLESENAIDSPYGFTIEPDMQKNWSLSLRGWIKPSMLSNKPLDNFFAVEVTKSETLKKFKERIKDSFALQYHENKNLEDLWVIGKVKDDDIKLRLISKYFSIGHL